MARDEIDAIDKAAASGAGEPAGPMSALDHYRHAETLLDYAADCDAGDELAGYYIAKAHAHAVLAGVAVAALTGTDGLPRDDFRAWYAHAGDAAGRARMRRPC